jgi:hypothetical protein
LDFSGDGYRCSKSSIGTSLRDGVKLEWLDGRLANVDQWMPTVGDGGQVAFADLNFLKNLFGYRSFDELNFVIPDCYAIGDAAVLMDVLFPKTQTYVQPVC